MESAAPLLTREEVVGILQHEFHNAQPSFLERLFGANRQAKEGVDLVSRVELHPISEFFTETNFFRVFVGEPILVHKFVPSIAGSWGIFSRSERSASYIDPQKGSAPLEEILKSEAGWRKCHPQLLSLFLCECLLQEFQNKYRLLSNAADLEGMANSGPFGGGYEFDEAELGRCREKVSEPQFSTKTNGDVEIAFFALYGALFDKKTLKKITITLDHQSKSNVSFEVVSARIFSSVPLVRS